MRQSSATAEKRLFPLDEGTALRGGSIRQDLSSPAPAGHDPPPKGGLRVFWARASSCDSGRKSAPPQRERVGWQTPRQYRAGIWPWVAFRERAGQLAPMRVAAVLELPRGSGWG